MNEDKSRRLHDHALDLGNGGIRNAKDGAASDPTLRARPSGQWSQDYSSLGCQEFRQSMPAQLYIFRRRSEWIAADHPRSTAHPAHPVKRPHLTTLQLQAAIHFYINTSANIDAGCQFTESDSWHLQCPHLFAFSQYNPFVPHDLQRSRSAKRCKEV